MNSSSADGTSAAAPRKSTGRWHRVGRVERVEPAPPPPPLPVPPPRGPSATPVYDQLVAEYRARNLTVPRAAEPRHGYPG
ncbi:hypothetical protein [Streptomyces cavernicola]|uniref:Uncharacterized protein n=1 Tax=Streptomyces cavernicola TaxID=3043613 RepID=A0ABT6SCA5_9ACTN|nr:hypothetical protein [Streptomyces sp. B-S-A6]MDI3405831.1 hypothetical protein [Streptomyces sp. B-S-A6]